MIRCLVLAREREREGEAKRYVCKKSVDAGWVGWRYADSESYLRVENAPPPRLLSFFFWHFARKSAVAAVSIGTKDKAKWRGFLGNRSSSTRPSSVNLVATVLCDTGCVHLTVNEFVQDCALTTTTKDVGRTVVTQHISLCFLSSVRGGGGGKEGLGRGGDLNDYDQRPPPAPPGDLATSSPSASSAGAMESEAWLLRNWCQTRSRGSAPD